MDPVTGSILEIIRRQTVEGMGKLTLLIIETTKISSDHSVNYLIVAF